MIYYRRRQACTSCQDGFVFLRLPQNHEIIRLSGTARRIWEILGYPVSLTEIVSSLAAEFAANRMVPAASFQIMPIKTGASVRCS